MKSACLIVNLGTPEALTNAAIRKFLARFLSDRRVVDLHPALWQPILRGAVLPFRPQHIRHQYEHVWLPGGSPLTVHTAAQRDLLAAELPEALVRSAMTYTSPTIAEVLRELEEAGVLDLTVLPLYPQFAPSTVSPIMDQVSAYYRTRPQLPTLRFVRSWHTASAFVEWHAARLREELQAGQVDRIVFSYHSVPDRPAHSPATYQAECEETTRAISDRLGLTIPLEVTYQSVFGRGRWVGPATIERMGELPHEGAKSILVLTPGFFSDCIETSYELDVLNQEVFRAAGGLSYRRIAPPNSDAAAGRILAEALRSSSFGDGVAGVSLR